MAEVSPTFRYEIVRVNGSNQYKLLYTFSNIEATVWSGTRDECTDMYKKNFDRPFSQLVYKDV